MVVALETSPSCILKCATACSLRAELQSLMKRSAFAAHRKYDVKTKYVNIKFLIKHTTCYANVWRKHTIEAKCF
jgi:hypothetical protein